MDRTGGRTPDLHTVPKRDEYPWLIRSLYAPAGSADPERDRLTPLGPDPSGIRVSGYRIGAQRGALLEKETDLKETPTNYETKHAATRTRTWRRETEPTPDAGRPEDSTRAGLSKSRSFQARRRLLPGEGTAVCF